MNSESSVERELVSPGADTTVSFLVELLKDGHENPHSVRGTVRFVIEDFKTHSFDCTIGENLEFTSCNHDRKPDSTIEFPMSTLETVRDSVEYIDFRDPKLMATVKMSGELGLAGYLLRSCLRPSEKTVEMFKAIENLHETNHLDQLQEVERVNCPSQLEILESIEKGVPIVITGYSPFDPESPWTLSDLTERYKDVVLRVRSADNIQTMETFVEEINSYESMYSENNVMEDGFKPYTEGSALPAEMIQDFGPMVFERSDLTQPQLWFGSVPSNLPASSLHRDIQTGFLAQYMGRKRLTLYSANQARYLSPFRAYNNFQLCWFKPEDPQYSKFPFAEHARSIDVVLSPGEILVQPVGWFHQVYALESPNMSVSYFIK